jgi:hypothetical protein
VTPSPDSHLFVCVCNVNKTLQGFFLVCSLRFHGNRRHKYTQQIASGLNAV